MHLHLCPCLRRWLKAGSSASAPQRVPCDWACSFLPAVGPLFQTLWVRSFPLWSALLACCWRRTSSCVLKKTALILACSWRRSYDCLLLATLWVVLHRVVWRRSSSCLLLAMLFFLPDALGDALSSALHRWLNADSSACCLQRSYFCLAGGGALLSYQL